MTASGTILLTDLLGNRITSLPLPIERLEPARNGSVVAQWGDPPAFGIFNARLNLEAGGQSLLAEQRLMMLPALAAQAAAALLVVIIVFLLLGRRLSLGLRGQPSVSSRLSDLAGVPHQPERVAALAASWIARDANAGEAQPTGEAVLGAPFLDSRPQQTSGPVVLVVDDDDELRGMLGYALGQQGFRSSDASSGEEALEVVRQREPDVVLLDMVMPGLTGIETCRRIREVSAVPIIMLTALAGDEAVVSALEVGADDFCTKPISLVQLAARIRAQLRRRQATQLSEAGRPSVPAAVVEHGAPPATNGTTDHSSPSELLRRGQEAARAGDGHLAYRFFVEAAEQAPAIEEAWLWRAGTTDQHDEAVECLKRVLQINPHNERARQGLRQLESRSATTRSTEALD
jgi:DNA-binding response OmpR family regulator